MPNIFLVEDDRAIAKNLTLLLRSEGFSVIHAPTREEALTALSGDPFDLALIDISLPDGNGFTVYTEIKAAREIPVIFLTASGDEASVVTGLNMGADDYITKPFEIEELLARIRAALRKRAPALATGEGLLTSGKLALDPGRHTVRFGEEEVSLTSREFDLLQALMENRSIVLRREQLLSKVWGYDYMGETNVVDVYIRYLRSKIDEKFGVKFIHTVRGVGYVFRDAEA